MAEFPPTESPHETTARVADHLARFKSAEAVPLPILGDLVQAMDILRSTGLKLAPGAPRDGMCVRLPAGVGKSTAAGMLERSAAERTGRPVEAGPVLVVTLDVNETVSLWSAILRELRDPYWDVGYPRTQKKRALKFLGKRGVELIVVDEFNHSVDRGQARELMNTVKEILNAGTCPIVVMGTDEELEKLPKIPAFERRMVHAPAIGPLVWSDGEHERNWRGFLQGLDAGIRAQDILPERSGLGRRMLAEALCEACDGVIGYAYWVVQDALTEVLKRRGDRIEAADLSISVGRLFVKFELFDRLNPVEALS